ncbi:glycosyltransferase family 32 protein [Myriangium duriaei CBS 260.36]|uniref:Glycosyltransferase family 32 protein n=1 Tax=Myriangium duriaei CBS 260.36 TaxID=1168546 RepID=A0A9P4ISS6_9PEZI|nr:glycosyltransferase family 32 protein [Myriangium duriaei CBS 260.36]
MRSGSGVQDGGNGLPKEPRPTNQRAGAFCTAPPSSSPPAVPSFLSPYRCILGEKDYVFHRDMNSFQDFPSAYSEALIAAQLKNENPNYEWPPVNHTESAAQQTIPPNIHFIWFQNEYHDHLDISQIPTKGSHAPDRCREFNPDFNVRVWDAQAARALLQNYHPRFLPIYDAYPYPIQRIDAFKYFVLWHFGGVYVDMDIACRRPLNPLLAFPAWYPKATLSGVNNDLMASRARHPLLGLMLDSLASRQKNLLIPYLTIYWSTGPQFASDMLETYHRIGKTGGMKGHHNDPDGLYVLPAEFYSEKYTFFGHSPGGTWHGKDVAVILWFVERPWIFFVCPVVIFMVAFMALRVRRSRRSRQPRYCR